jgi:hypothetical protein
LSPALAIEPLAGTGDIMALMVPGFENGEWANVQQFSGGAATVIS